MQISSIFTDTQRKKIQIFTYKREKVAQAPYSTSTNMDFAKKRLHYSTESHKKRKNGNWRFILQLPFFWAENEARTRDPNLGKVVLYQLSYFRKNFIFETISFKCEEKETRTPTT